MAIYHCSIKVISRGKGKSAVAASAYRSGEIIHNMYDGVVHDFTKKRGIVYTEIMLPSHAPPEFNDRSVLWNSVEKIEKSKNSQLAREIEVALPKELDRDKQIQLVRKYVEESFVSVGMCADFAIHDKKDGNPHAHIMLTMRPIQESGEWGAKSRKEYVLDETGQRIRLKNGSYKTYKVDTTSWNDKGNAEKWRKAWADISNQYLMEQKSEERIDHRSFKRQEIQQIPTVHLGVAVSQMQKRGIVTERGKRNQQITEQNRLLKAIKRRIGLLMRWIKENHFSLIQEPVGETISTPSILERLEKAKTEVADRQIRSVMDLGFESHLTAMEFFQKHNITTYSQLVENVQEIKKRYQDIRGQIKQTEKQIHDKQELVEQAEQYIQYHKYYKAYMQIQPDKKTDYQMQYSRELALYEIAQRYLHEHLVGEAVLKPTAWREEIKVLSNRKNDLYSELNELKEEISEAENIKQIVWEKSRDEKQIRKNIVER